MSWREKISVCQCVETVTFCHYVRVEIEWAENVFPFFRSKFKKKFKFQETSHIIGLVSNQNLKDIYYCAIYC